MQYDYDLLGNRVHQASMDAGERWTLSDVAGKPIRSWDAAGSCGGRRTTLYAVHGTLRTAKGTGGAGREDGIRRKPGRLQQNHRDGLGSSTAPASSRTSGTTSKATCCSSQRELLQDYKERVNWLQNPACSKREGSRAARHTTR